MAVALIVTLSIEQQVELEQTRDHAARPYLRERAAAVLKIAGGASGLQVALSGLLKLRDPDSVYAWVKRYLTQGLAGLTIRPGRGRKPAYAPQYETAASAQEALLHVLHQAPAGYDQSGARWRLITLLAACGWLALRSLGGLSALLARLAIHYKRAREHVHSPDPAYVAKLRSIRVAVLRCPAASGVFVFQDEITLYRQPRVGATYELAGHTQPLAELGHRPNWTWRIAATLNAWTGQVIYVEGMRLGIAGLVKLYQAQQAAYPAAPLIHLAQDNWPIHFHPDVLATLRPQRFRWPPAVPANWPTTPKAKTPRLNLPLRLHPLPTYASWTNPIEKLWRWLNQEVLCGHRFADDWEALKKAVRQFLDQFAAGSAQLLRYVGLTDPLKLYHAVVDQP
jgi:hypothetical protein